MIKQQVVISRMRIPHQMMGECFSTTVENLDSLNIYILVRVVGLEPTNSKVADFKSAAYTNSATLALYHSQPCFTYRVQTIPPLVVYAINANHSLLNVIQKQIADVSSYD